MILQVGGFVEQFIKTKAKMQCWVVRLLGNPLRVCLLVFDHTLTEIWRLHPFLSYGIINRKQTHKFIFYRFRLNQREVEWHKFETNLLKIQPDRI